MKTLRPYQDNAVKSFSNWFNSSIKKTGDINDQLATILMATGLGKTFTACNCIKEAYSENKSLKILWVAHREELIDQAYTAISSLLPDIDVQIEMSKEKASPKADVIVGSVQTLSRKRKHLDKYKPDLIVIDEHHHYSNDNIQYNGLFKKYPDSLFLGLTATPYRFSGGDLPLGRVLADINIGLGVQAKYLAPPKPEVLNTNVSLASVKTKMGDFVPSQLSEVVNTNDRNWMITKRILAAVEDGRQGIVFGVDVEHCKAMTKMLRAAGLKAEEVYGETDKEERRDIMNRLRDREVDVLVNVMVCTEGFDVPHLSFVCVARPTRSLGLFCQMVGRGLRPHSDKKDCLIIDIYDKIKVSQNVITYKDLEDAGDIDGSRKRSKSIIDEDFPEELSNFPTIMKLNSGMWRIDGVSWDFTSWNIDKNQWVIAWSKKTERKETNKISWTPMYLPKKLAVKSGKIIVRHKQHGEGKVIDVNYGNEDHYLIVDFDGTIKTCGLKTLETQQKSYDNIPLKNPIKRLFYIVSSDDRKRCKMMVGSKEELTFKVISTMNGDQETVNEVVRSFAKEDDIFGIVRADAPWKLRKASEKQKKLISNMISWGRLDDHIDVDSLSGGDASALMDQVDWRPIINNIFGCSKKEQLIGYEKVEI